MQGAFRDAVFSGGIIKAYCTLVLQNKQLQGQIIFYEDLKGLFIGLIAPLAFPYMIKECCLMSTVFYHCLPTHKKP